MANQKYEAFLHIAETGSFKQAAHDLGYTQAGISYLISSMERELGIPLFVRDYGGAHLTTLKAAWCALPRSPAFPSSGSPALPKRFWRSIPASICNWCALITKTILSRPFGAATLTAGSSWCPSSSHLRPFRCTTTH